MAIKAVIFDAYNTLFRNETSYWADIFGAICQQQNLAVGPQQLWDCWKSFEIQFRQTRTDMVNPDQSPPFKTYQVAWEKAFEQAFNSLGLSGNAHKASEQSVAGMAGREPYEDTIPVLGFVNKHWKSSLLTNADNSFIMPLIERHGLMFSSVVTSEMAQAYKPNPKAFEKVLSETGVSAAESVYVGDTLLDDIHGAKLSGMLAVWINRDKKSLDDQLIAPDFEISELMDLIDILVDMSNSVDRSKLPAFSERILGND